IFPSHLTLDVTVYTSRGILPAVLKNRQRIINALVYISTPDDAHNSAHGCSLLITLLRLCGWLMLCFLTAAWQGKRYFTLGRHTGLVIPNKLLHIATSFACTIF